MLKSEAIVAGLVPTHSKASSFPAEPAEPTIPIALPKNFVPKPGWVLLGYTMGKRNKETRRKVRMLHTPCGTIRELHTTNVLSKGSYKCAKCYSEDLDYRASFEMGRVARANRAVKLAKAKGLAAERCFIVKYKNGDMYYTDTLPDLDTYDNIWLSDSKGSDKLEELVLDESSREDYLEALRFAKEERLNEQRRIDRLLPKLKAIAEPLQSYPPAPEGYQHIIVVKLDHAKYLSNETDLPKNEAAAAEARLDTLVWIRDDSIEPELFISQPFYVNALQYCYMAWNGSDIWEVRPGFSNPYEQST